MSDELYSIHTIRGALDRVGLSPELSARVESMLRPMKRRSPNQFRSGPITARIVEARGKALTIREWSRETGIHFDTIRDRLRRGWPEHKAVTVRTQRNET